ncbi:MAG: KEOPS complex subunit Cgi121 [Halonotius sp.]
MKTVAATTTIDDIDAFLADIEAISDETGAAVQCFDADYVAGESHLRRAVSLAARAREQGTAVAHDPAIEILLYAAGRRQINQALEMGVSAGEIDVAGVVTGGDETAAAERLADRLGTTATGEEIGVGDTETLKSFFSITDRELAVVDGGIDAVVLERVALLDVTK